MMYPQRDKRGEDQKQTRPKTVTRTHGTITDRQARKSHQVLTEAPKHLLHGRCPDDEPCAFTDSPCSQQCWRLQPKAIRSGMLEAARVSGMRPA